MPAFTCDTGVYDVANRNNPAPEPRSWRNLTLIPEAWDIACQPQFVRMSMDDLKRSLNFRRECQVHLPTDVYEQTRRLFDWGKEPVRKWYDYKDLLINSGTVQVLPLSVEAKAGLLLVSHGATLGDIAKRGYVVDTQLDTQLDDQALDELCQFMEW